MADLPVLSASTKRRLALQWSALLDSKDLTGKHFQWRQWYLDRMRTAHIIRLGGGGLAQGSALGPEDNVGVEVTVAVAEERFKALSSEYWRHWTASGSGYEVFVEWLGELRRSVSAEVASIWKGDVRIPEGWYERACGPAIERTLSVLVREWTNRARNAEIARSELDETLLRLFPELRASALKKAAEGGFRIPDGAGAAESGGDKANRTDAGTAVSDAKGRKRGPKPDIENASKVAEIIKAAVSDGRWQSAASLDDLCQALDEAKVPTPRTWKNRDNPLRSWFDACCTTEDKKVLVKAIQRRLKAARNCPDISSRNTAG